MNITSLLASRSSSDLSVYTTASNVVPTASKLAIAVINSSVGSGNPNIPTISAGGITAWSPYINHLDGTRRTTLLYGLTGAGGNAQAVIDFASQTQTHCDYSFFEIDGALLTGTNGVDALVQSKTGTAAGTSFSLTLDNALFGANSLVIAGFRTHASRTVVATSPSTLINTTTGGSPGTTLSALYRANVTVGAEFVDTSSTWAGLLVEIKAVADVVIPIVQRSAYGAGTRRFNRRLS